MDLMWNFIGILLEFLKATRLAQPAICQRCSVVKAREETARKFHARIASQPKTPRSFCSVFLSRRLSSNRLIPRYCLRTLAFPKPHHQAVQGASEGAQESSGSLAAPFNHPSCLIQYLWSNHR
jgi:hypothetical protein